MLVKDFMTKNVISCQQEQTVEDAANLMAKENLSLLPIVDAEGVLVGVITESDFVGKEIEVPHALASIKELFGQSFYFRDVELIYAQAKKKKLSDIMSKHPRTVTSGTSLTTIINLMISKNLKKLPVVDDNKLVGIITRRDLLKAFSQLSS